ncbi:MAG: hypothetical protein ACLP5V_10900 [Candidatus Bathyarchaeia archaeon]
MEKSVHIAIKSGLSVIEKCLRDILQATKTRSESKNWLFKHRHYDLSEDVASELTVKAEEMLKEIQELQRMFEIGRDDESARWHIISNLDQIWTMLSDLSPDKLRGYGQMRPEDGKLLTMHVDRMNAIRKDMEKLLSA